MSITTQLLIALGIAVILPIAITTLLTRYNTDALLTFVWGDQEINLNQSAHLITSTAFAMNGILYFAFLGYWIGLAALILQVFWCGSYVLLSFYARRIKSLSRFGTLHGGIGLIFGQKTEKVAAVASIVGFALTLGWEISIGVTMFQAVAQGDKNLEDALQGILIFTLAGICAVYTILGGLRGNIYANEAQNWLAALAMIAAFVFLIYVAPSSGFEVEPEAFKRFFTEFGIAAIISNVLFSIAFQFVDMSAWQNLAATKSGGEIQKKSLNWSALAVFIFPGLIGTLMGIYMRFIADVDGNNIVIKLIELLSSYPTLCIFIVIGFIGAMLSTVDGLLLASSQALVWDLTHRSQVSDILNFYMKGRRTSSEAKETKKDYVSDI